MRVGLRSLGLLLAAVACTNVEPPGGERENVVRAVLGHPDLERFLHRDQPGRTPLVLAETPAVATLARARLAPEIRVLDDQRIERDRIEAVVRFSLLDVGDDRAVAQFEYRIEGVVVTTRLHRRGGHWVFDEYQLRVQRR
ncbi:MAG: hypothetical protein KJ067_18825 [Vicinamibacteria bacterium]|nr:hypothetical protein [Vicinamibacteria bacterium]